MAEGRTSLNVNRQRELRLTIFRIAERPRGLVPPVLEAGVRWALEASLRRGVAALRVDFLVGVFLALRVPPREDLEARLR